MKLLDLRPADASGREVVVRRFPRICRTTPSCGATRCWRSSTRYSNEMMELACRRQPIPRELIRQVLRERRSSMQIQPVLCGSALHGDRRAAAPGRRGLVPAQPRGYAAGRRDSIRSKKGTKSSAASRPRRAVLRPGVQGPAGQDGRSVLGPRLLRRAEGQQPRARIPARTRRKTSPQLWQIHADRKASSRSTAAQAGDIVGVIGLRHSITGDTLCDTQHPILLEADPVSRRR